jgi:maleylpyruvate isomerase
VDLAAGATWADLPPEVVADLMAEVAGGLAGREDCPAMRLVPEAGDPWVVGPAGAGEAVEVTGPAPDLLAWLIGRSNGGTLVATTPDGRPPAPPPWL